MRKCLMVISLLLVHSTAHADFESSIALKGGPNAATATGKYQVNRRGVSGGIAGSLQWHLVGRLSLAAQVEVLYTPRGAEVIFEGEYAGKIRSHYVDVLVSARPGVRFGPARIYLVLGTGLSILESSNKWNASGPREDITGDLRRIDVALVGGAGLALHVPRQWQGPFNLGSVFLEARHDRGLIDTDLIHGGFRNRTSSLMLGLSFALGSGARTTAPAACQCP